MMTDEILLVMAYLGAVAGAVSGVVAARRKNMDVIGAVTVACATALGGGTVRDLMLGRFPVFWVKEEGYVVVTLLVALVTYYSTRLLALTSRSILIPDALGLGVFTVWGTAFGLQSGASWLVSGLMGIITGIVGGVLRDEMCGEIPYVFGRSAQLYATCSIVGAVVYLLLVKLGVYAPIPSVAGVIATAGLRLLAVRFNLRLPVPRKHRDLDDVQWE